LREYTNASTPLLAREGEKKRDQIQPRIKLQTLTTFLRKKKSVEKNKRSLVDFVSSLPGSARNGSLRMHIL
jgi:hypothetical protein